MLTRLNGLVKLGIQNNKNQSEKNIWAECLGFLDFLMNSSKINVDQKIF